MRTPWLTRARIARDRGDADPILVLVSLAVLALVTVGITLAIINAQQWGTTHSFDSLEQTSEDAARLSWTADVGTATKVIPAALAGTTAQTSVRFDTTTRTAGWPAGAQCRAVTWSLEDTVMDPNSPNAVDPATGKPKPAVAVHRDIAYYAQASGGGCVTTSAKVGRAAGTTPVKNAERGAKFSYVNGHLRDLVYPNAATPSVESCEPAAKTDAAGLTACATRSTATKPAERTAWEWADPNPVQVLLEMRTDQAGMGAGYGTQIGWRELAGRLELTGDPTSPVTDTLANPIAPAAPGAPPALAKVTAPLPENDQVTIARVDNRDLDGWDYRCQEFLGSSPVRWMPFVAGGSATPPLPAAATEVPGTRAGYTYTCAQRGWVVGVTGAEKGKQFTGGTSPWSNGATQVRRPLAPALSISPAPYMADGVQTPATVTWPAIVGATSYNVSYTDSRAGNGAVTQPGTSWTSPVVQEDSALTVTVTSTNAGGTSNSSASVRMQNRVDAPAPSLTYSGGSVGTVSWAGKTNAHHYDLQFTKDGSPWGTDRDTVATSFGYNALGQGEAMAARVRAVGSFTDPSSWVETNAIVRPVNAPTGVGIAAQSAGSGSGTATATATASCSEGMQAQYWWRDDRGNSRGWSTDASAAAYMNEGDTNTFYFATRCANTATGRVSTEVGTQSSALRRPYTAPATPSVWSSGNGYTGTNVTFSWSSSGAGYYRVTNSAGNALRYSGSGTSVAVARESGSTCAVVHAYRSQAHYNAGVGSVSSTCASTVGRPAVIPAGCVTTGSGPGTAAGMTLVTASACSDLRARFVSAAGVDEVDPDWSTRHQKTGGAWSTWVPAMSTVHDSTPASTIAVTQVITDQVSLLQFRLTITGIRDGAGTGSDSIVVQRSI